MLAQCIIAAGRTMADVDDGDGPRRIHSLHGYFMRPGDDTQPIRFAVERMRDGNSFSTRRVHAIQDGMPILSMITSFQEQAGGLDHQDPMPDVPRPEDLPSLGDLVDGIDHPGARHLANRPIELRHVEGNLFVTPIAEPVARQSVWMKAIGRLPDDPLIHAAVLAYASDYTLLEPVLRRHELMWTDRRLRPPASTTPCGSTVPCEPTTGSSTTRSRRRRPGAAASAGPDVRRGRHAGGHRRPGGHGPRQGVLTRISPE